MEYNEFIAIVNASAIIVLLLSAIMLLCASRFRGENGYAAVIIVVTTIPVYAYHFCRSEEWYSVAQWIAPLSFSMNTLIMPLLWLFVHRNFNPGFRFTPVHWLHFLPALICFVACSVYIFSIPFTQRFDFMIFENTGQDTRIGKLNATVLFTQMFVYFPLIFVYLRRVRRLIGENFSEADWMYKAWIPKFTVLMAVMFLIVFVCYACWPRSDEWLFQILNVIVMYYLVFHALQTSHVAQMESLSVESGRLETEKKSHPAQVTDPEQLKRLADAMMLYLDRSQAFLDPNLMLQDVAAGMDVSPKKLSRSINAVLNKSFFEVVNRMRVERAKVLLLDYKKRNMTLDTLANQSGFNSRFTLFNVFKKIEGNSPTKWLKQKNDVK